jgi:hypothetical protein
MIISHKYQLAFVKTRKTAGSTLEALIFPYLHPNDVCTGSERDGTPKIGTNIKDGHMPYSNIVMTYPEIEDYFKFTIERNPWDKVVSSYFWHQKIKPDRFGGMNFEKYVLTCELLPTDWSKYACNRTGEVIVDRIYKYEEMDLMYKELNQRFDMRITEDQYSNMKLKSGIRTVRDYRELHTTKTIEHVYEMFANEIDLLGYEYVG